MRLGIKLFKNTSYLTIGNQIGNLLQFLFFLYFARRYGEEVVGQYSFAFSFTFLFSVFADLGLSIYLIRKVARDQSGNRLIFARCLSLRIFSLALFSLLAVASIFIFLNNVSADTIKMIFCLGFFHIFFSIADVILAEFKGHDMMGLVALLNAFVRFIISGAGILLIALGFDFLHVLISFPVGSLIYLIICIYFSLSYFKGVKIEFKHLDLKSLFKDNLPFALTIIFSEAFYHQDILMLRLLQNNKAVGIFSAANTIVLAFMGVLLFVHTALLPSFSRLYLESKTQLLEVSEHSLRYLVLIGMPIAVGCYAISDKLITLLYADRFEYSVSVLRILSWTIVLGFAAALYSVLLTAIDRQKEKVIAIGSCLAFNFILNFILIPAMSYKGAAVTKLATEALHFILMAYLVSKYLSTISIRGIFVKSALSCLLMYIVIQLFNNWTVILLVPVAVLVYMLSLGAVKGYTKEEIEFMKRFRPKVLLNG